MKKMCTRNSVFLWHYRVLVTSLFMLDQTLMSFPASNLARMGNFSPGAPVFLTNLIRFHFIKIKFSVLDGN